MERTLSDAIGKFGAGRQKAADEGFMAGLAQQRDPGAMDEYLRSAPSRGVSSEALKFGMDQTRHLLGNDTLRESNEQASWNNDRVQSNEAGRPAAVSRVNEIRSLAALGTPEGKAKAQELMSQSSDIFAASGMAPEDIMNMINGNVNTANVGLASNDAFQKVGDANVSRAKSLEADKLFADVMKSAPSAEEGAKMIRANPDLDPDVASMALAKLTGDQGTALFGGDVDPSRSILDQSISERQGNTNPIDAVVNQIIGVESSGNPNAKNSLSSASGLGQFTDSTWLSTIRKHRPDIQGTDGQLLSLKNDAALGREMTTRLTEDGAKMISGKGLPVTPGNLYLAHFAGHGGFGAIMKASDSQSLDNVLGAAAMKANPFLAGKNVGWIKRWADKKMGGAGSGSPASDTSQEATDAITRALNVSAGNASAADNQSLLTAGNVLGEQGQTLIDQGVTDEMFNQTAPVLAQLTERPDRSMLEADVVKKLHSEVGDDDGLPIGDLTDQLNRVSDKYGIPPDMAAALMKSAIEQTTWGARWIKGERQLDHDALDRHFRKFIDLDAKDITGKLRPTVEQYRALRAKRDGTAQIEQLKGQLEAAKQEYFTVRERASSRPELEGAVEAALLRYQAILGSTQKTISQLDQNPLWTANTNALTGR